MRFNAQITIITLRTEDIEKGGPIGLIQACGWIINTLPVYDQRTFQMIMLDSVAPLSHFLKIVGSCIAAVRRIEFNAQLWEMSQTDLPGFFCV